ncbi:hypothetical protein EIN_128710 [Entamoeba invadens IP1]|uniref:Secreted protein n=1 Tax=Entamoeba invadens IP1 TaxID=370355 RepID=L7FN78_ENTIV|nr:hypothetical protein EIN_128710 [Entamoeba invadens IP1]ELP91561.1 hypothetical protein EIN_128710 [Entamoeba invadens IP1]|eukprot:XP_004258332.1 hypothetical protein EIN_128710 [Entamoeba invadens IP1]
MLCWIVGVLFVMLRNVSGVGCYDDIDDIDIDEYDDFLDDFDDFYDFEFDDDFDDDDFIGGQKSYDYDKAKSALNTLGGNIVKQKIKQMATLLRQAVLNKAKNCNKQVEKVRRYLIEKQIVPVNWV